MGIKTRVFFTSSALVLALAYYIIPIFPDTANKPILKSVVGTVFNLIFLMAKVGHHLGIASEVNITRAMFGAFSMLDDGGNGNVVQSTETIDGVRVLIFRPKGEVTTRRPGVVYYHGGGWTFMTPETYAPISREIAERTQSVLISVDYRLSPEHIFPAAFDDCLLVTKSFLRNADKYGVDPDKIGIMGGLLGEYCRGKSRYEFGPNCEYLCWCSDSNEKCYERNGTCKEKCVEGRFGPGCQYVNGAYKMVVGSDIVLRHAVYTVDGREDRCVSHDGLVKDPHVTVYLQNVKFVSELLIVFNKNVNASGFKVYIGKTQELSPDNLCSEDPGISSDNRVEVFCSRRIEADYLTILLPGESKKLEICEAYLNIGRNLEYKRQAFASSVYQNNTEKWGPANAVNGNVNPQFRTSIETAEHMTDPWWYVYMGGKRRITKMKIRNHFSEHYEKLSNASIFVCNETDCSYKKEVYRVTSSPVTEYIEVALPDVEAKCIGIQLLGTDRQIVFSMVDIYGGCPENRCGTECRDYCFCKEKVKTIAEELNGNCSGECETGWLKNGGKCNTSACEDGNFGLGCRYQCNCEEHCEPWSGRCLSVQSDRRERCKQHWYGKLCQGYNKIAESLFTIEGNATYESAERTVDGNVSTCSAVLGGQGASWIVPLPSQSYVDQIAVYVNKTRTGFGLEIMAENENKAILCRSSWFESKGLFIAYCGNVQSTHVRVRTRSSMQICEVAVLDCASGTFGDLCENTCYCKVNADCNKETGECPDGGCQSGYFGSSCDLECYPGYYGPDCSIRCGYCEGGEVCDRITGWCKSGCSPGYRGLRCDQECRDGTYGDGCNMDCGYCLDGVACDKLNGNCPNGCAPGFYGSTCTSACEDGKYGTNCEGECGSCRNGFACRKTDGVCRNGCQLGKQPPYCQTDCASFTYGEGCYGICGQCLYNQTCNPVSGVCDNGCEPGFYVDVVNPMCIRECSDGYFGYNCTQRCAVDVCKDTDVCNKTNGDCLHGCKYAAVQAPKCVTSCTSGTYGYECQYICGRCHSQEPCNITNGICLNGCADGFSGAMCQTNDLEMSESMSTASIVLLAIGLTLLFIGLVAAAIFAYVLLKRRRQGKTFKEKVNLKDDDKTRNASIVSRVYENNINMDTDNANEKKQNISVDSYQLSQMKPKGTFAVEDLWEYVLGGKCTKTEMKEQFDQLVSGLAHPCEAAKRANNLRKNRYKEIFAYDHTRVKLYTADGDSDSDYINASFISGYNRPHRYIAAQGPTEELVNEFWMMVWQQKCRKIVMLTNLVEQTKMRCAQYWPDEGEELYGSVSVTLKEAESFADFDIRTFTIKVEGQESREVRQFHFTSWPDRQVPEYASTVVLFWSKVRTTDSKDNVPILVHCSAGIGRSGTFIALDYLVDQASVEGYVNVFQCVQNLRHQRVNMVQTQAQYNFLHEALVEALLCPSTPVPCERLPYSCKKLLEIEPKSRKTRMQNEYEKLQHITKFRESMTTSFYDGTAYMAARREENKEKNRNTTILPSDVHRPWLTTRVYEKNDYINAVFLPSYREDRKFLITQNPLPDTIVDFWRMVYEHNVTSVVSFDKTSSQSEIYWAAAGETITFIPFQVHHVTEKDHEDYIERTVKLLNAGEPKEKPRVVKIFECQFWQGERKSPTDTGPVLSVLDRVQKWQEGTGNRPLVVHCLNGAHKSGLFCVISATIEQLKEEREVALAQTLKQMRIRRHQIVPFYEQYKFAHDAIIEFLKNFDTYSNFII